MNFVKLFVPVGKQYVLHCPQEKESVAEALTLSVDSTKFQVKQKRTTSDKSKPLEFSVSRKTNIVNQLVEPSLRGKLLTDSAGRNEVELTTKLGPLATRLINIPANMALGALFGTLACYYLVPDIRPLIGLFLSAAAIPFAVACAAGVVVRMTAGNQITQLVESISGSGAFKGSRLEVRDNALSFAEIFFTRNSVISIITACTVLGGAFYLHAEAWQLWTRGEYEKSEDLCRNVLSMASFILGSKSPVAADCTYYLAECLRCQGKFAEAEALYLEARKGIEEQLGAGHSDVADSTFNLARAYEGEGKFKDADETYRQSIKFYEALPDVGPNGVWLARVLDRHAMCLSKQHRFQEAEAQEKRALSIDQHYMNSTYRDYGEALNDLGVIYFHEGRYAEATSTLGEAIRNIPPSEHPYTLAAAKYNLGKVYLASNENEMGNRLISEARSTWGTFIGKSPSSFSSDQALYQAVLDKTKADYEVPNWDTRSEEIVQLIGRI